MLRSGFLRAITDCRSQKAVSADPIIDTDHFKAIFLSCRIIYNDTPIILLDIYSVPEFLFLNGGNSPFSDSCERGFFNLRVGGGGGG